MRIIIASGVLAALAITSPATARAGHTPDTNDQCNNVAGVQTRLALRTKWWAYDKSTRRAHDCIPGLRSRL